jgi:hypothetical protein
VDGVAALNESLKAFFSPEDDLSFDEKVSVASLWGSFSTQAGSSTFQALPKTAPLSALTDFITAGIHRIFWIYREGEGLPA